MADFYATYSASAASSSTVTALQGTVPWVVAGNGTAGVPNAGVVTVQGITSGQPIPISGSITAINDSVSATGAAVPAKATFVGGSDGTNLIALKVSAAGVVSTDGSGSTQPVSGTVTANQGGSWTVAASQSGTWNINNVSGTVSLPTGAATESTLSTLNGKVPAQGQAAMAASTPVVIASNQSAVPVSGSVTVSGTVAATQSGTWTVQPGNTANTTAWLVTQATTTAAFQAEGSIAFGSLTNAYQTVFTPAAGTKILQLRNNTNAAVSVSFDAGTTLNYVLDAGDQVSLDLRSNLLLMSTTAIQAKYTVGAPTSGSFRVNGGG